LRLALALTLALTFALALTLALGLAFPARRTAERGWPQQLRDCQIILAVLLERFERFRRVVDLIRLDDAVMVGVERLDHRRQPAMTVSARG
jgi:hypothetical protein